MGVAKILYYHHKSVLWTNGSRLKARMRRCISNKDSESEREIVDELSGPDFLWLSDPIIAGEPLTTYQRDFMYSFIDARYQAQKPTLLTINVESSAQLDDVLGAATADLLRENSFCHFCDWKTHRKTKSIDSLPEKEYRPIPYTGTHGRVADRTQGFTPDASSVGMNRLPNRMLTTKQFWIPISSH